VKYFFSNPFWAPKTVIAPDSGFRSAMAVASTVVYDSDFPAMMKSIFSNYKDNGRIKITKER